MRVMESFRFIEKAAVVAEIPAVSTSLYGVGAIGAGVSAAVLIAAFAVTMFLSRHGSEGQS
jgi:hypothetical protein